MAKIAFILLCHERPDAIIRQAEQLTAAGDYIAIHFDARGNAAQYRRLRQSLDHNPNVAFAAQRVRCGWGEWSLVRATLKTVRTALKAFPDASHFYMLSGDCMAIKTAEYIHQFLKENNADFIETFDYFESDWIKTGMKEERVIYRHFFNERTNKRLFYGSLNLQRRFNLKRKPPDDIQLRIGSQWWCLRRATLEKILKFAKRRGDVRRFFSTTWIPDESFFQTLVPHLISDSEIRSRTLTFLMFTDYGMPLTFYNDHYDLLIRQDYLFTRKISPEAQGLKDRLGMLYAASGVPFQISDEGPALFRFLTAKGRIGQRFTPRIWETKSSLARDHELLIILCKKWHVGKRVLRHISHISDIASLEYIFNEEDTPMPDLGGIQTSIEKRTRHRRALMRMLFDYHGTNRMIICMDTADIEAVSDFMSDRSLTRLLEIDCDFSDDDLVGHAIRVGLAGEHTAPEILQQLLPTLRHDIAYESERLRDADFPNYNCLRENGALKANTDSLANFLSVPIGTARDIAKGMTLFAD